MLRSILLALAVLLLAGCAIPRHYKEYDARDLSSYYLSYNRGPGAAACRQVKRGAKVLQSPSSVWDACIEYYEAAKQAEVEAAKIAAVKSNAEVERLRVGRAEQQAEEEKAERALRSNPDRVMLSVGVELYMSEYCYKSGQAPAEAYIARVSKAKAYANEMVGRYDHQKVMMGYHKAKDLHFYGGMFEVSHTYCKMITIAPESEIGIYDL